MIETLFPVTEDDIEVEDLEKDKTEVTDRSEAKRKSIVRTISAKRRKTPTQEIGDRKEDGGTVDASSKPTRDDYEEIDYKQMPIEEKVVRRTFNICIFQNVFVFFFLGGGGSRNELKRCSS